MIGQLIKSCIHSKSKEFNEAHVHFNVVLKLTISFLDTQSVPHVSVRVCVFLCELCLNLSVHLPPGEDRISGPPLVCHLFHLPSWVPVCFDVPHNYYLQFIQS